MATKVKGIKLIEVSSRLISPFHFEGEKGYKEGHEHDEGKKGHHDKVLSVHILTGIIYKFKLLVSVCV